MWEKEVYELDVAQQERMARDENALNVILWDERKVNWLRDADRARSLKIAPPDKPVPAFEKTVEAPPFAPGPYAIKVLVGPERVADGVLILPPVPAYDAVNYAPGVQAIGNRTSDGGYWVALPEDTIKDGETVIYQGRKLEKVEGFWLFGRKSFYYDRGAAA